MSKFISNVITLFSATLAGQILGLIVMPIISRLYTPSDFGIYQLFTSVISVITVISCFSYNAAIQLPKKDEDAANIVVLCLSLIAFTSIFATIFFFIFSSYIENLFNVQGFSSYFFLLPLAIICSSLTHVFISWISRKNEFGLVAKGNFYSSVSGKAVTVGSGIISPSPFGLIFGTIINNATIVVVLLRRTLEDINLFQKVSYKKIKQIAYRYKSFPQYRTAADLTSTATMAVTPFMLGIYFTPAIIGYYAMALMIFKVPTRLLGSALYQVFFQKISVEKNINGNVKNSVETVYHHLISLALFPWLIIMIIGPELFTFALGIQWTTAGVYAQILAPWMFVAFLYYPLLTIFNVFEKQAVDMWLSMLYLVLTVIVIFIGGYYFADPIIVMLLLSILGTIIGGYVNNYTLKIAGVSVLKATQEILRYFFISLIFCVPLIIAKLFSISNIFLIGIAIFTSGVYYAVVIFRDVQLKQGLLIFLKNITHK